MTHSASALPLPDHSTIRDSGSQDRDSANPDPNPFGAPGPLAPKAEKKSHHNPGNPQQSNPFSAPPASQSAAGPSIDWGTIVDELPFGLLVLGPNMELLHENGTPRDWLGISVRDQGGIEPWLRSLCPDSGHREKVLSSWQSQIWRNQLTRTFSLKGKNQKVREIEFRSTLQPNGGLTVILQDVTDNFRAQELQRQNKLKFRALFEQSREGVILLDRQGIILESNPAFLDVVEQEAREVRLIAFEDLLHPASLKVWQDACNASDESTSTELRLRTSTGSCLVHARQAPVESSRDHGDLSLVFIKSEKQGPDSPQAKVLLQRLQTVARKAQALLHAVPDLILLLDEDLSIADFSPPPEPWKERKADNAWRGRPLEDVWPVLGSLIAHSQSKILEGGKSIHAELEARQGEKQDYEVTASNAGDGQILVVVRNQSEVSRLRHEASFHHSAFEAIDEAILFFDRSGVISEANPSAERLLGERGSKLRGSSLLKRTGYASASELIHSSRWPIQDATGTPALLESSVFEAGSDHNFGAILNPPRPASEKFEDPTDPFVAEKAEHLFRNQLQLATSLHQFEPASSESREASLRWQIRLRVLMASRLDSSGGPLRVAKLLHDVSNEIASLLGRGPGSRSVSIEGSEDLLLTPQTITSLSLFVGEVLRIVLTDSASGAGPDLSFRFLRDSRGFLQLQLQSGLNRRKLSEARAWEGEILEILAAQMQGSLTGRPVDEGEEWTLCAFVLTPDR